MLGHGIICLNSTSKCFKELGGLCSGWLGVLQTRQAVEVMQWMLDKQFH